MVLESCAICDRTASVSSRSIDPIGRCVGSAESPTLLMPRQLRVRRTQAQPPAHPKSQDGEVEAIRLLRLARRSAMKAQTQTANHIQAIVQGAPASLRDSLRGLLLA